jgi:hypothetical protein
LAFVTATFEERILGVIGLILAEDVTGYSVGQGVALSGGDP